jgi:hypothetical protein
MNNLNNIKEQIKTLNKCDILRLHYHLSDLVENIKENNPNTFYSITYYLKNQDTVKQNVKNWRAVKHSQ